MPVKKIYLILPFLIFLKVAEAQDKKPVRIAIAGMTHGHVGWILKRKDLGDIEVVGFSEQNRELANRLLNSSQLDKSLWFEDLDEMISATKPEAVCAFGSIYDHLEVVEKCAPLGIHVMVEKPLAVSMEHAVKMEKLARKHDIFLLTNYETTWYSSNQKIYNTYKKGEIGKIRKMVFHDGHQGPIEIGCSKEFLSWLTDPVLNGGGAVIDFGCYGANLSTWLMDNQKPISVTAVIQQIKSGKYPKVDDEATVILEYPDAQAIIQASWNWPYSRKSIEVYGQTEALFGPDGTTFVRRKRESPENVEQLEKRSYPHDDPFAYLAAVINREIDPSGGLYSLENNMIVVEILSKAIQSSKEGRRIFLNTD